MKWFKHYSDMHRGRSINDLLDQLGHTGLCFFLLQEMCAEKLEKDDQGLTEADCSWTFHTRIVRQNLRISPVNLVRLLDACAANGLLSFEFSGSSLTISMPILLNLLERNTKRARKTRTTSAQKSPLDKDIDKEEDRDKDKELKKAKTRTPNPLNAKIWEAYKAAYFNRYKIEPVRNAKVNTNISQLASRVGDDAIGLVDFYLKHNDGFYLKNLHPISLCLTNAEALYSQMKRNQPVTSVDVRNFEKLQNSSNLQKAIRDGENF